VGEFLGGKSIVVGLKLSLESVDLVTLVINYVLSSCLLTVFEREAPRREGDLDLSTLSGCHPDFATSAHGAAGLHLPPSFA
jgi:hypothetical protein